jgi:hypothetical protein
MARTDKKVGYSPTGKLGDVTPDMAATGVEEAFRMLEGALEDGHYLPPVRSRSTPIL